MIIPYNPSQEVATETRDSGTSKSNRHSKDNIWNRSFYDHPGARTIFEEDIRTMGRGCKKLAHAVVDSYKAAQSFVQSCFGKPGRTRPRGGSVATFHAFDDSSSSTDSMKHYKSKEPYTEKEDGDGTTSREWAGRGKYPDRKS